MTVCVAAYIMLLIDLRMCGDLFIFLGLCIPADGVDAYESLLS